MFQAIKHFDVCRDESWLGQKNRNIDNANEAFGLIHYRANGPRRKRKSDNVKFLNL